MKPLVPCMANKDRRYDQASSVLFALMSALAATSVEVDSCTSSRDDDDDNKDAGDDSLEEQIATCVKDMESGRV